MSVAIASSARTMSLLCKVLAPPSPDPPQRLYAAPWHRNRLESSYDRGKERDGQVARGPPDGGHRGLARGGAGFFGLRNLGLHRANRGGRRGREPRLRQSRLALDPPGLPRLARRADARRHGARLLLGRGAAVGRGRICLLPKGLETLRYAPSGLDCRERRAHNGPEKRIRAGAS